MYKLYLYGFIDVQGILLKIKVRIHFKLVAKNTASAATIEIWDQESEIPRAGRCSEVGV